MARIRGRGTKLEVFSGKAGPLNQLIFEILRTKKLAIYDTYLEVRRVRGYRHKKYQIVDRRMKKLLEQGWLILEGTKKTQPGTDAPFYRLSNKGYNALDLDKVSMDRFLSEANEQLQLEMTKLLDRFQESVKKQNSTRQKIEP